MSRFPPELARFALSPDELVAIGLFSETGRNEDKIATKDSAASDVPSEVAAMALNSEGIKLTEDGKHEAAIAVYDDLLARFGTATELPLREQVAKALFNKGVRLGALGRSEDAIAVYDDLLASFGTATELPLRELVAKALFNKGVTLGALGRSEDEIAVYDDLLARFGTAPELPLREQVAKALFNKGVTLGALGRSEEAIAVYDDLLARFGTATELPLRELVAKALFNKGVTLGTLGRSEDAIAVYDDLLAALRHRDRTAAARAGRQGARQQGGHARRARPQRGRDCGLRRSARPLRHRDRAAAARTVANALLNKGVTLGALGRSEEAIAVYDDLLARFGTATELPLREQVAKALVNKGVTLGALGRSEDAIATLRQAEEFEWNDQSRQKIAALIDTLLKRDKQINDKSFIKSIELQSTGAREVSTENSSANRDRCFKRDKQINDKYYESTNYNRRVRGEPTTPPWERGLPKAHERLPLPEAGHLQPRPTAEDIELVFAALKTDPDVMVHTAREILTRSNADGNELPVIEIGAPKKPKPLNVATGHCLA